MLFQLKRTDDKQSLPYIIQNEDGTIPSLEGATVQFIMGKKNRIVINKPATIVSALDGQVQYDFESEDTIIAGNYMAEFVVEFPTGERQTFPTRGYINVNIEANLDASMTNIIVDYVAERQGEFTKKLDSILLQAGNISMSAINEYSWTSTEGQLTYEMPNNANYDPFGKWFFVYVGGIAVDPSLIDRRNENSFTLNIESSLVPAGVNVMAKWTEPVVPITSGHHSVHEENGADEINITKLKGYNDLSLSVSQKVAKNQIAEATITYYVSTTGNDSNDGKTVGTAFATLDKAFDVVADSYILINGTIKIDIQAGTYNQVSSIPARLVTKERLQIVGKKDANGIPTVIFDGTGTNGIGIFGEESDFVLIKDIKFQNYTNAGQSACGIHFQHHANVWTSNVHVYNCDWGISVSVACRLYVEGGVVDYCKFGVRHYAGCVGTVGYKATSLATGTIIKNCIQAGVYHQNQSSSHVDYCTLQGNLSGVACVNQSRAHVMKSHFENNTQEGVLIYHQSTWMNDQNTFAGNTRKWTLELFSSELSSFNKAHSEVNTFMWTGSITVSNTVANTHMKGLYTILAGQFVEPWRKLKVVAMGSFGGTGTKSVSFRTSTTNLGTFTSSSTAGGTWKLELEVFPITATSQKVFARWIEGDATTATSKTSLVNGTHDFSINQALNLYAQPTTTAGTVTVDVIEAYEVI